MRRPQRRQRGYVLVLTLAMLALAAVSLQAIVLRSMELAVSSADASDELQRRWGMDSLQQVILPRIPAHLQQAEQKAQAAVSAMHASIILGGQRFDLTLADEQAKVNVNMLYDRLGRDGLAEVLQGFAEADPDAPAAELQPLRPPDPDRLESVLVKRLLADLAKPGEELPSPAVPQQPAAPKRPAFISFQQVFPSASPEDLIDSRMGAWAGEWTCWGNGRITLRRASPQTLALACRQVLSDLEIRKLLEARDQVWNAPVSQVLNELDLVEVKRARLDALLGGRSECYSMWIIQRSAQRNWHRFAVRDGAARNRLAVYEW